MKKLLILVSVLFASLNLAFADAKISRTQATQHMQKGDYQDALVIYKKLLKDTSDHHSGNDLSLATQCLNSINQRQKVEEFVASWAKAKEANFSIQLQTARYYLSGNSHHGSIIDGEYIRDSYRGERVSSQQQDRVAAIQYYFKAESLIDKKDAHFNPDKVGSFYIELANAFLQRRSTFKLQIKSDLEKLPDLAPQSYYGSTSGAPTLADGTPVYYAQPNTFDAAKSDGERYRYLLWKAAQEDKNNVTKVKQIYAEFLHSQFSVGTLQQFSWFGRMGNNDDEDTNSGLLTLHTLKNSETIARLASGVKRFTLPDEHNFLLIHQQLFEAKHSDGYVLANIYLDRRQFSKAVAVLQKSIARQKTDRVNRLLDDIINDWAKFSNSNHSFPAGSHPTLGLTYRNAKSLDLSARKIDIAAMHRSALDALTKNPKQIDWNKYNWNSLSQSINNGHFKNNLGPELFKNTIQLKPRSKHWDTRKLLTIPLKEAGAYYIEVTLPNGKKINTVVWIDSLALVTKPTSKGTLYTVVDVVTGKPLPKANIAFFAYRQEYLRKRQGDRRFNVLTKTKKLTTDQNGQVMLTADNVDNQYRWSLHIIQGNHNYYSSFNGRLTGHRRHYNNDFNQTRAFAITDRPVYLPGQKVYGKFWHRKASYTLQDESAFAHRKYSIEITDPQGQRVGKPIPVTSDAFGGIDYALELEENCKLGIYRVQLKQGTRHYGGHSFRVEKYKKPEYEVTVESPKEPVKLGEKFEATVKATYYHGAPVTEAKVKVKVMRHDYNDTWFPIGPWDWLYGNGYGWMGVERGFYPGWDNWGCKCPPPFWWHRPQQQPEVVLEQEFDINPDGTVKVEIDSALAKEVHGDKNQKYSITAEVVDASRRTIVGSGSTLATSKAFNVTTWLDRGHANIGDKITANIAAKTLDGKDVAAKGTATLFKISVDATGKINEQQVKQWPVDIHQHGKTSQLFTCDRAGQYKLSVTVKDKKANTITGATFITIRGEGINKENYAYNHLEITSDKRTYKPGDTAELLIKTKQKNSTVYFFLRNGKTYQTLSLDGQTQLVKIPITLADMPNTFVDAFTVVDGKVHTAVCELIVPPEKRVLNVEVVANKEKYKPRAKGTIKIKVTDINGKPVVGSVALTIYDKALEYISGGSNIGDIKSTFWKWRRHYYQNTTHSLHHYEYNTVPKNERQMPMLGVFGHMTGDIGIINTVDGFGDLGGPGGMAKGRSAAKPMASMEMSADKESSDNGVAGAVEAAAPAIMVRNKFADLVKWKGDIVTNAQGIAEVPVEYPDNLTTWKIKTWAMSHGTRVGEGSAEVITSKDLIIRLQAPRFFVEKDEVTLSAIVHNYHDAAQQATVTLELEGGTIKSLSPLTQKAKLAANNGEQRIDWKTKVSGEGIAIVRMKVVTANDSDAMEMTFPVYVHGMLKQQAWSNVILPKQDKTSVTFNVPAERRPEQSRLEVRYSPTIAGSIISALPYLSEYPYGCTEQTLNRFVPTVICQKLLLDLNIDLEAVRNQQANLNPQEIGDDKERLAQWKRWKRNPVFDPKTVAKMTAKGVERLVEMQNNDGGWGWFSGYNEYSYPHTTAVVVHGLIQAKSNGADVPKDMISRGINWLAKYEAKELQKLINAKKEIKPFKTQASDLDAFVRLILAENAKHNVEMLDFLFRDKLKLSTYGKSITAMAFHYAKDVTKRDAIIKNIEQLLVYDDENQTAYLNLGNQNYWWRWYGSEFEAQAWYLKLLALTNPKSKQARGIVKYLVNNRKHATYWNSTRDTAYCIEAIAAYLKASGEFDPNATVEVLLDGKLYKTVKITKENIFSYDNKFTVTGDALTTGKHTVEIRRKGKGPLYTNTYLTNFTKEDFITKAGLEVKIERRYYKLTPNKEATDAVAGKNGQVVNQKIEKFIKTLLKSGDKVLSGDLIEVELIIESKNDYEYLLFEDLKPAGCENVEVRSGYINKGLRAYMQIHDEKSSFFVRQLQRGKHNLRYQLRAEIPGKFSALPAKAEAMYAPELKANSDEIKLRIEDKK